MSPISSVIIVGAGPSGLLLSLLLRKAGIPKVLLLERDSHPTNETRAVYYQPIALYEFKRAGILEAVESVGFRPREVAWRDMTGKKLFELPMNMVALTMDKLAGVVQRQVEATSGVQIAWSHKVIALGESDDKQQAWLDVQTPTGTTRLEADYIVGCDGGSSTIRKCLFGAKSMPGFTWDMQLLAADIKYNFPAISELADSNLFMHPDKAWLLFRPGKEEDIWRVIYTEEIGTSEEEAITRCPKTLQALIPGHPSKGDFELQRVRPYKIHQRIVDSMRKGRFVLASDAAHLCCPYGALGLNGGIADVGSLSDCFQAIHEGKANETILDIYSQVRREKWKELIDAPSQRTLKTIFCDPKEVGSDHPLYKMAKAIAADPSRAKAMAPNPLGLRYDFTPHLKLDGGVQQPEVNEAGEH